MGDDKYIDTPGTQRDEKDDGTYDDIFDYYESNMGKSDLNKLEKWWKENVKK